MSFDLQQAVRRVFRPYFPILYKTRLRALEATWLQVRPNTKKDPAELLAWSVVGGFSERLVPNALEQTEGRATAPKSASP